MAVSFIGGGNRSTQGNFGCRWVRNEILNDIFIVILIFDTTGVDLVVCYGVISDNLAVAYAVFKVFFQL
jgi:nitrate reductase NapE component